MRSALKYKMKDLWEVASGGHVLILTRYDEKQMETETQCKMKSWMKNMLT